MPERFGHIQWHQVDRWYIHGGQCPTLIFSFRIELSLASWMMNGIHTALLMLCPPALGLIVQEMAWRFYIGHCPSCVYLCLMYPHVTRSPRPSPSVFVCCKRSNAGGGYVLGMRLIGIHKIKLAENWKSYIRIMSKFQKFIYRTLTLKLFMNSKNCPVLLIGPCPSF